ncbi:MAG: P-loop NTPase [Myxococcota bacterium]
MDNQIISLQQFRDARHDDHRPEHARVVAITGGKGGVGKSFLAANLAAAWSSDGVRTLAVDADFGMADLNLMLGVAPDRSALDVLCGVPIGEVLVRAHGVDLLPGLNGSSTLANLDATERRALLAAIDTLEDTYDVCVIDAPPGISDTGIDMSAAASHVVVVLSPEPVSLADAYSCLKAMCVRHNLARAYVVPNNVANADEAAETFQRLEAIVDRFLGVKLVALPHIVRDAAVATTCALGVPVVHHSPDAPAARAVKTIARRLSTERPGAVPEPVRLFRNRIGVAGAEPAARRAEASER